MKEDYQKALKKVILFFLPNPVPLNRKNFQKQKGPGTSDHSLFRLQSKFRKLLLLDLYYLTKCDDVIESGFWVILKITSANLWKPNYDIMNYCRFESGKCGKEGKKLQKFEYLENEKSFLDEIKNIFHSFWRPIIWWKNKNLIKKNNGCNL